jgi:hypothetical protein
MRRPRRIIAATVIGLLLTVAATRLADLEALLYPGFVISQILGADSVHYPGRGWFGLAAALIWIGSIIFWGAVAYGVLSIRWFRRAG